MTTRPVDSRPTPGPLVERDLAAALGARPLINAWGHLTWLGGSLMPEEVRAAMESGAGTFVSVEELLALSSRYLAPLIGVESALVTAGAAAGLVLAVARSIAGADERRLRRLPDTSGLERRVVVQRAQLCGWDQPVRLAGAELVEVGHALGVDAGELEAAIEFGAACVLVYAGKNERYSLPLETVAELAHARGVPVIVDAAAELPPRENLRAFCDRGADAVLFSGGKMLEGPQATGLMVGRADFVDGCLAASSPNMSIGRPLKVSKEEIYGLVRAVELFLQRDPVEDMRHWDAQIATVTEVLDGLDGVTVARVFPAQDDVRPACVPRAHVMWDEDTLGRTAADMIVALRGGEPGIVVGAPRGARGTLVVNPVTLRKGEACVVAARIREEFGRGVVAR